MDDPFVSCPYDPIHQVPRSRLQRHIVKCEWRNPDLEACPYNATHRIPKGKMKSHVLVCPSKACTIPEDRPAKIVAGLKTPRVTLTKESSPQTDPMDEYWD